MSQDTRPDRMIGIGLIVRGAITALFGIVAMVWPVETVTTLVVLWGVFAFVDGIIAITAALSRQIPGFVKGLLLLIGVIGILAGLFAILRPFSGATALVLVLGIWLIAHGLLEIVNASTAPDSGSRLLEILTGLLWILLGVLLVSNPGVGAVDLAIWMGALALVVGVLMLVDGLILRSRARRRAA